MTDQVRRDESAESELLDTLLDAADAPAGQPAAATPESTAEAEAAAQPTPENAAQEPQAEQSAEAEAAGSAADEPGEAEQAQPVTAEATEAAAGEGASFTPVAEEAGSRPRKLKDLQPGMELEGRVTSIALYGVFVDIGVGRDGLVHISEMSDTRIDTPSDLVAIGDTVKVRIKSVDPEARRISLTMRSGSGEKSEGGRRGRPKRAEIDKEKLAALKVGDIVEGVITGFASFGAFADIGVGKDGLIHVSELAEGRVEKAEDAVKIGDRFQFKVLEVDPEGTRISLSLRRAQRTQKMQQLEPGQVLEGTVSGIAPFGAFVDIGVGRDGLVHISALSSTRVNRVEDVVKVGDKVTVKVLEVDQQSKRISLTMRLDEGSERADEEEDYTSGMGAAGALPPRPSAAASTRFISAAEARAERDRERQRRERRERDRRNVPAQPETYSTEDVEEEFVGDATLEDLLSKFGGPSAAKRDRRSRHRDEDDDDSESREDRRQRDAIKRTLQQVGRDE